MSLKEVTLGENVTSIAWYAFSNCCSLAIVYNNSSLDITAGSSDYGSVGRYAYEIVNKGETAKGRIEEIDNVSYYINGTTKVALSMIDRKASNVSLEEDTTAINQYAFSGCTNLTSITIPARVTEIGVGAFINCTSLQTVDFGDNSQLKTIGIYALKNCTNLTSITIPASLTLIDYSAFSGCSNVDIYYQGTLEQWLNIDIYIDASGFWSNCNLYINNALVEEVTIDKNIKKYAFYGIISLKKVTIGENVTSIGDLAFDDCASLTSVTIESDDIYKIATSSSSAGKLLANAMTVKVLKTIVDTCDNSYLENSSNFTTSTDGEYTVFTKKVAQ